MHFFSVWRVPDAVHTLIMPIRWHNVCRGLDDKAKLHFISTPTINPSSSGDSYSSKIWQGYRDVRHRLHMLVIESLPVGGASNGAIIPAKVAKTLLSDATKLVTLSCHVFISGELVIRHGLIKNMKIVCGGVHWRSWWQMKWNFCFRHMGWLAKLGQPTRGQWGDRRKGFTRDANSRPVYLKTIWSLIVSIYWRRYKPSCWDVQRNLMPLGPPPPLLKKNLVQNLNISMTQTIKQSRDPLM